MPKKILVIDDETELLKLIQARLESKGYTVVAAGDGEEGLAKLKTEKPDLIITDIAMPKMDGYTFVLEVKKLEDFKKTPIVVLTAKDKMADIFKIEGIHDYVVKPFDAEELLNKIKKHI